MTPSWIKPLFVLAALYDGILGLVSVIAPQMLFDLYGVEPPNHVGYVQFPALLLLVFAMMFSRIAANPLANRGLIPYGMGLKAAYSGIVFWHQVRGGVPPMWIPWAWLDLVFLGLFALAYRQTRQPSGA